jgi:hypothetical protein
MCAATMRDLQRYRNGLYKLLDHAPTQWSSAFKAGLAYFIVVFGFGFLLGTFRMLVMVPVVGEISAVMLEMPIMLAISWFSSRWLSGQLSVPAALAPRLVMGGLAFALLMVAEVGLSIFGFGRTLAEHLASYCQFASIIGLLGQAAFASFPAIQLSVRR